MLLLQLLWAKAKGRWSRQTQTQRRGRVQGVVVACQTRARPPCHQVYAPFGGSDFVKWGKRGVWRLGVVACQTRCCGWCHTLSSARPLCACQRVHAACRMRSKIRQRYVKHLGIETFDNTRLRYSLCCWRVYLFCELLAEPCCRSTHQHF